ncbi:MAG: glutaredoxin family protein [Chloroflexi bacterium]|jgi:glutaredoxin|nr:glutaredoxin family protein [Chloroflexota bacterium]
MQARETVPGSRNRHHVLFYGLSTCIWCRRTRQFLESNDVAFDVVYVDLLQGAEREAVVEQVRRWNPSVSFPTLVIDNRRCIIGYRPEEMQEALGL